MPSTKSTLPIELLERIFDKVDADDRQDLRSCAVACREFLPLARKRLFSDVSIVVEPDEFDPYDSQLERAPSHHPHLLGFVASDPYVASIIRQLHFHKTSTKSNQSSFLWNTVEMKLAKILPKLIWVQQVSVHSSFLADWVRLDERLARVILQICQKPTVQAVQLHYVGLSPAELMSFARVPRLTLVGVYLTTEITSDVTSSEDVHPHAHESSVLCDLSVTLRSPETAETISALISAARSSLKTLKWLSSPYHIAQDTRLYLIDLESLPSLLSLEICAPIGDSASFLSIVDLFARHRGRCTIETIEVLCDFQHFPNASISSSWNWTELDAVLASPVYAALKRVKIGVKENIHPKQQLATNLDGRSREVAYLFRRNLPLIQSRGLLI